MTLGVRIAAFNQNGEVLLVRHTYLTGWYLPGGGVDLGECLQDAARRELFEECGAITDEPLQLKAVYLNNRRGTGRDHVALYQANNVAIDSTWQRPSKEIAETGFFALNALPKGITRATQQRLLELAGDGPYDSIW